MLKNKSLLLGAAVLALAAFPIAGQAEDAAYDCDAHAAALVEAHGAEDAVKAFGMDHADEAHADVAEFASHGCTVEQLEAHAGDAHEMDDHGDEGHEMEDHGADHH